MSDILDSLVTNSQRDSIRAAIETARTLPRQAFTSATFFDLEVERLFSEQWTALCFSQQIAQTGDLYPLEFAGIPLLIVQDEQGKLRVFHNIVPYDGCLAVIKAQQSQTEIRTPYHGWRYDLQGQLIATPYWDGSDEQHLESAQQPSGNLIEINSQIELGIVFVNLSGNATDFDEHITPLRNMLIDYRTDDIQMGCNADGDPLINEENLATNWKTHYENWALNVLHEAFTHEIYAESTQIPRVNKQGEKTYVEHIDGVLMALSYREEDFAETYDMDDEYTQSYAKDETYPHLGKTPEVIPEHAFIGSLFPNVHIAVFAYFIHIIIAIPVSAGQTRTIRAQFYEPNSAVNPDELEQRLEVMEEFIQAGFEDERITEAVQKGRRSPVCEQQFYAPFWDNMHYTFSKQVLDALEKNT